MRRRQLHGARDGVAHVAEGRFAALPAPEETIETIDYGPYPVGASSASVSREHTALDLPVIEDSESIQLALVDVMQAIAANQLDSKRAGLLLYGLQVASANVKNLRLPVDGVRTITHTDDGAPLAPQSFGMDVEDYDEEDEEEYDAADDDE